MAGEQPPDRRRRLHGRRITDLQTHPDAFVTVPAFAEYVGVTQKQVRKWITAGVLDGYRLGGTEWRIRTADAITFVERNRYQPL